MIRSFVFDSGKLVGENIELDALRLARADPGLHMWVDLESPTDEEVKAVLEGVFSFHPLAIEDCVMVNQIPKIEDYDTYVFLVMHGVDFTRKDQFSTTEVNFFLGREFLVSYHTRRMRSVNALCDRLRNNIGAAARSPDRLMHTVLDMMIDNYKPVLDELAEEVQEIEDSIFDTESHGQGVVKEILQCKKEINLFRSIIRPQGEVAGNIARGECKLVRGPLLPYYRDISDNIARFDASARNLADQLLITMDVYLNKAQHETNQIIKALAIMTALTIPVSCLSSWYGMNFEHMPELKPVWGYPYALVTTLVTTGAIWWWLRNKKWL